MSPQLGTNEEGLGFLVVTCCLIHWYACGRLISETTLVLMGLRFLGRVLMLLILRWPYRDRAIVRGIGVALMVRRWGVETELKKDERWRTPKRCCSSMTTKPSFWFWISSGRCNKACVPMTRGAVGNFFLDCPVTSSGLIEKGLSSWEKDWWCCSAKTWVGARTRVWKPCFTTCRAAEQRQWFCLSQHRLGEVGSWGWFVLGLWIHRWWLVVGLG